MYDLESVVPYSDSVLLVQVHVSQSSSHISLPLITVFKLYFIHGLSIALFFHSSFFYDPKSVLFTL